MKNQFINPESEKLFVASIDIGTNSTHLLIASIHSENKSFSIEFTEKSTTRLGERDEQGNLSEVSILRVLETLRRFKEYCKSYGVGKILSAATSAVREAPNGQELIRRVRDEMGIQIELISGAEEARLIYLGVLSGMVLEKDSNVIIDIGGGSTELILANNNDTKALTSARVGAVRLKNDFFDKEPMSPSRIEFLQTYIQGTLEPSVEKIKKKCEKDTQINMIATSGTAIALGNLISSNLSQEKQKMHGYKFSADKLGSLLDKLLPMSIHERKSISALSDRRAEIIIPGALILQAAIKMLEIKELTISERALREGLVVDWMLREGMLKSEFNIQSNIRKTTVIHKADKLGVNKYRSENVASIAIQIYDQTKDILHNDFHQKGKQLLWAAAILYTSGKYINLSGYHKHSWYLIKNCELLGYSQVETNIIASIARYHRKTLPKKRHESWLSLTSKEDKAIVIDMSLILRLAASLDKRPEPVISLVNVSLLNDNLTFRLKANNSNKDLSLEKWSLKSCSNVLKELKNLELKVD